MRSGQIKLFFHDMNTNCCGVMGWLFGHKFRPRYDENQTYREDSPKHLEAALARVTGLKGVLLSDDLNAIKAITDGFRELDNQESFYIQDVCTRCGESMVREPEPVEEMDSEELLEAAFQNMHGLSQEEWDRIRAVITKIIERAEYKLTVPVTVLPTIVAEKLEEVAPEQRSELMKSLLAELLRRKEAAALLPSVLPIVCPSCHVSSTVHRQFRCAQVAKA